MGSIYLFICEKEGEVLDNLVKIGFSGHDNPLKRTKQVSRKFKGTGMTHKCHAYYVTEDYKDVEKRLHEQLGEEFRAKGIMSRLDNEKMCSRPSQEHYEMSIDDALNAFQQALEKIEGFSIKCVPCSSDDNPCLYQLIKEE